MSRAMTALDARTEILALLLANGLVLEESGALAQQLERLSGFVCAAGPAAIAARLKCLKFALGRGYVLGAEQLLDTADQFFELVAMPDEPDAGVAGDGNAGIIALLTEIRDLHAAPPEPGDHAPATEIIALLSELRDLHAPPPDPDGSKAGANKGKAG